MNKITPLDITLFIRQFAIFFSAGVPLSESLYALESSSSKPTLRAMIHSIRKNILSGKNLSEALQQQKRYFDALTIQLIRLGEQTGTLDTILLSIATYYESRILLTQKIRQALFYPTIILVTSFLMLVILFIFVIPRFAELFADMQDKLPLITRLIFSLSDFLNNDGLIGLSILTPCIILLSLTRQVKSACKKILFSIPSLHQCQQKILLARFARQLAICFKSGIPLSDALQLTIHPTTQPDFARTIYLIRNQLNAGQPLHAAMRAYPYFPALMVQMIKTGEDTGKLDDMLDKIAQHYESDTDHFIARLQQLLEPLIMLVLGVLIGGLVIGMYLPIFKLGSTL